jgi:DNA-binding NtrC family response regulator
LKIEPKAKLQMANKEKMFVVEDDPAWGAMLQQRLSKTYDIQLFVTGEEAVEKMASEKPKYIVQDYHLDGEMTGLDTLKQAKKILGDKVYVIMFSAQDDVEVAIATLDHGAYDYVVKSSSDPYNRLKIILRNIQENEKLKKDIEIRIKREYFWLGVFIFFIFFISSYIYLREVCPEKRLIKWDPFEVQKECDNASSGKFRGG